MATYELSGIVRPETDDQALDREASKMERALGRAARLTPDLDLGRARQQLSRLAPSLGLAGVPGLGDDGGSGGAGTSIQAQQLAELKQINRTLRQDAVSGAGEGGPTIIGGLPSLPSSGALAAGGALAGLPILGGLIGRGAQNVLSGLFPEQTTSRDDVVDGTSVTQSDLGAARRLLERLRSLSLPELPGLDDLTSFSWPDLPTLPDALQAFSWPDLPALPSEFTQFGWPDLPALPAELAQFDWPDLPQFEEPQWVSDLLSGLRSAGLIGGGGSSGGDAADRRDDGAGLPARGDVSGTEPRSGPIRIDAPDLIDDRALERVVRDLFRREFASGP